mmetsp:Transcript_54754/g.163729  ORF Transcript_54754/g.163729 Transcript_54754/m.163729 type:complete len:1090 (-) Transcript_54754:154-3423(-)
MTVRPVRPSVDGGGLHRKDDPGVGAFTAYHGHDHVVVGDGGGGDGDNGGGIPAGAEIFVESFPGALAASGGGEELKSTEWLEEHGACLDNLRPGPSSSSSSSSSIIPQAGRGAFAARALVSGEIVAPVPVIPLRKDALGRYHRDHDEAPETAHRGDMLLRNYCYGHPESNVALFPLGPVVNLINHAPEGKTEREEGGANVELRWSPGSGDGRWFARSAEKVLKWSPSDNDDDDTRGPFPAMELIALRDIQEGEEIYMNYGPEWAEAWSNHVRRWSPVLHADRYVPPETMNVDPDSVIPTGEDLWDDPLPENVMMVCRISDDIGRRAAFRGRFGQARSWVDAGEASGDDTFWTTDGQVRPCAMLGSDEDESDERGRRKKKEGNDPGAETEEKKYTVMVDFSTLSSDGNEYIVRGVPRRAIEFVDRYYSKDQFLAKAFRHEIGLPEGIFPKGWMDVAIENRRKKRRGGDGDDDNDQCGLYMAESSIPHSGLGMYTAKEIPLGTFLRPSEVVIHQYEHDGNNELRMAKRGIPRNGGGDVGSERPWLLFTYFWESRVARGSYETEVGQQTITMIPGLGMLANSHTGLVNAMMRRPDVDAAGLHRSKDPGAGAFSEFHNYRYEAVSLHPDPEKHRAIPAGMELFVEYGDDWFADREYLFGPIPLSDDFANADHLLDRFVDLAAAIGDRTAALDLWNIARTMVDWSPRMERAMPQNFDDVKPFQEKGTAMSSVPDAIRSPEWLKKHGLCLDNIRPGRSNIRQAGRGAFATRFLPEGIVVAPAPAAHIHRRHLEIYEIDDDDIIEFDGHQLLLNYCYGHPNSSMLLFPYSPVVNLINHPPRGAKPNVAVRWSSIPTHNSQWLGKSVDRLMEEKYAGLVMEFVALRDIEEGEEVYVDYGPGWQKSWNGHAKRWEPYDDDADEYVSASALNAMGGPLRTEEEQEEDPYPPNVQTICYVSKQITTLDDRGPHEWIEEDRLVDYADYGQECVLLEREDYDNASSDSVRPLRDVYRARVKHWEYENMDLIVTDIPRSAVELVDRPYTRDQFLGNAFRHEIHVPRGMFPRAWLDLLEEEEEDSDGNGDGNGDEGEQRGHNEL